MIRYEDEDSDIREENQSAAFVPRIGENVIMRSRMYVVIRVIHTTQNNLVRVILKERYRV
ncbi:hypothetical protein nACB2_071 [Acinetobacter phage nACB2]|nr:hypothetical protein nACB2_071 [Acinetobacter phage nACB2]